MEEEELLQWQNFNAELDRLDEVDGNEDLPGIGGEVLHASLGNDLFETYRRGVDADDDMPTITNQATHSRAGLVIRDLPGNLIDDYIPVTDEVPRYVGGVDTTINFGTSGDIDFMSMWADARNVDGGGYRGYGRISSEVRDHFNSFLSDMADSNEISQTALKKLKLKISEF